ncbi:GAF domain-containing protein [Lewinella cohaerens]|uniref:GAF domain-containing protein n=1 Tax=Lewinella cohaerens TaxID=70995 RepID=UPI00035F4119|nr:GAF domain-containing protein [Lewinella cohaerens]
MQKVITQAPPATDQECAQYLPIKAFFEKMSLSKEVNPYSSTFSFMPFIEKMREKRTGIHETIGAVDSTIMEEAERNLIAFSDPGKLDTPEKRQAVISMLFPALFFEGQMGFVSKPFTKEFFYITPALQELFSSDDWEVEISGDLIKGKMGSPAIEAGKLILHDFHGQQIESNSYQTMTFRHSKTMLERHFKINVVLDYVKTTPLNTLPPLNEVQIYQLFQEWGNEQYWLENFPPEDFSFEGLVIGYIQDVTEVEVLSRMKEMMVTEVDQNVDNADNIRQQLSGMICSYLQMPDVVFGSVPNRDFKYATLASWSILGGLPTLAQFTKGDFCNDSTYGKTMNDGQTIIIGDLQQIKQPGKVTSHLIKQGYRSLLLAPQRNRNGQIFGVMELASKQPYRLNNQLLGKLEEVISLYSLGSNRWIQEMDNTISFFIQKQFTYIHPSVEWKFQEVTQQFLLSPHENGKAPILEPIAFKNVYPLYGQADIVGSSQIRNRSIEADMLDNLQRVQKVIKAFRKQLEFQLLDIYLAKTEAFLHRLENGGYVSSDESQIVELLTEDIHPLLRELNEMYDQLPKEELREYCDYLDPKLNIVYRKRKDYEDSVHELNELISNYIDKEVAKKQKLLPHFFEKYVTDGVEYNIYLGQSLLQEGNFSRYFLQDFRLWQLMLMCEVTRLVEKNKQNLRVPLSTAQLIFVYNNALSIRFNMDEKQFDVDGAYNVRYEILKKRIDKAVIKGTNERLTLKGKLAIVWLQEKDRTEYLEYIDHLLQQGYITDEIEELELERLQGADGLKALRVTVAV